MRPAPRRRRSGSGRRSSSPRSPARSGIDQCAQRDHRRSGRHERATGRAAANAPPSAPSRGSPPRPRGPSRSARRPGRWRARAAACARRCRPPPALSSRWVSTLALIPGRFALISPNRRGPNISSRITSNDQRSPTNSSASAVPQASSYQLFSARSERLELLVTFSNFMVVFCNRLSQKMQVAIRERSEPRSGETRWPR